MTSQRKIVANRHNSRKSSGPRTAAGKKRASRNALRHGLRAITNRPPLPADEIERLARTICGEGDDPILFAKAVAIAENELALRAIREQEVACVERLRETTAVAFAQRDNSLELAQGMQERAELVYEAIVAVLPRMLEKYKDQLPKLEIPDDEIVPLRLKALLREPDRLEEEEKEEGENALDPASPRIVEREEFAALEQAVLDLIRLDRYARRAWSRQKRAIREFANIKLMSAVDASRQQLQC
jgi:hypothetical protein